MGSLKGETITFDLYFFNFWHQPQCPFCLPSLFFCVIATSPFLAPPKIGYFMHFDLAGLGLWGFKSGFPKMQSVSVLCGRGDKGMHRFILNLSIQG
jgi:hypothetical protein